MNPILLEEGSATAKLLAVAPATACRLLGRPACRREGMAWTGWAPAAAECGMTVMVICCL